MIDLPGDRLNSGFCLNCGAILMLPYNDLQCCEACTEAVMKAKYETEKRKQKGKKAKVVQRMGTHISKIRLQRLPIGEPVK
jgi:hypothetical protein